MDMFKLLTRSTGLQKSSINLEQKPHHTPSAGFSQRAENERARGGTLAQSEKEPVSSKKRKRSDDVAQEEDRDYFSQKSHQLRKSDGHDVIDNAEESGHPKQGPHEDSVVFLSEEECKQVLKRHKLKVTVLDKESLGSQSSQKTSKKSQKESGKKKQGQLQLLPQPLLSFTDLRRKYNISKRLSENLGAQGYREPTEVQVGALPLLLGSDRDRGIRHSSHHKYTEQSRTEVDLLTVAPTGSGKTLAFLIPIFQHIIEQKHACRSNQGEKKPHIQALVLAPTHELVDQIVNEARKLAVGIGIKIASMQKGMSLYTGDDASLGADGDADSDPEDQSATTTTPTVKADVIVSTPLATLNAISGSSENAHKSLPSVQYLVLDEADVLLDPLFREQTLNVWKSCVNPSLQTTLWSATIGSSIETLAHTFILDRRRSLKSTTPQLKSRPHRVIRLVVGLKDTAIPLITHRLTYAASEQGKLLALRQILHPTAPTSSEQPLSLQPPFLIFTQTIPRAIALHSELLYDIPIEAGGSSRIAVLHADLPGSARSAIMTGLRTGEIWVVITTDLLSRGIDIRGINGVVNYDIPTTGASYVHRAGRTGRQGRQGGVAITLYTKDDIPYVKNVANVIAASERARKNTKPSSASSLSVPSKDNIHSNEEPARSVQQWLLDALPDVSKNTKKMLKKRGVESRRTNPNLLTRGKDAKNGQDAAKVARRNRISTKSGYDRRIESRKKGAVEGSLRRRKEEEGEKDEGGGSDGDEEWAGLDG